MGRKEIDADLLDELEMILLTADVGVEATDKIIQNLTDQVSRKELKEPEALIQALKSQLEALLEPVSQPLSLSNDDGPFVILMVGVNGVGKTTTIGKLAKKFQNEGKSVMLAAGDTFRAAAWNNWKPGANATKCRSLPRKPEPIPPPSFSTPFNPPPRKKSMSSLPIPPDAYTPNPT